MMLTRHGISFPHMKAEATGRVAETKGMKFPCLRWRCFVCNWSTEEWVDIDPSISLSYQPQRSGQEDAALYHAERCKAHWCEGNVAQ